MRFQLCLAAAALCVACFNTHAQTSSASPRTTAAARLPRMVVTATGIESEAFNVPFTVEKLDATDLQERLLSRTVPEALKELPAVMVQKTAHGQGSPFIRGFTGFRTLMLVDGIRLNNSTFREGPNQYWNTIDPLSIHRLELVKGPVSILYGSDAIGGTVNALTSRRIAYAETHGLDGRAFYRHSTAEHASVGRVELSGNVGPDMGAFVGYSRKQFGDLRAGDGTGLQPKSGYRESAGDVKLEYFPAPNARLVAAYQLLRQDDAWRTHRTVFGRSWRGTTVGNDQKLALDQSRDLAYVQYHHSGLGGLVDAIRLSVSHHRQREFQDRVRSNNQTNHQGVDVATIGLSAQFESPSSLGRWVYGVEHYKDDVSSFRRNYRNGTLESVGVQGPVADDARYDLFGAYVQDSLQLGDRGEIILGARHTRADAAAERMQDPVTGAATPLRGKWNATVGSGRMAWKLDRRNEWQLFGGVSQGFRAPNLSDLTRLDIARSGELELPSTGLSPEHFTSFELGAKTQQKRLVAQAAYFYTRIHDLIDRVPADNPATAIVEVMKANVGEGYVHGIELSALFELNRNWSVWGNITEMRGEMETHLSTSPAVIARRPFTRIMPTTLNTGIKWESSSRSFWSELNATVTGKQDRLSPGDAADRQRIPPGGTPGYSVFHLRAGWRATQSFSVSATLENITDRDYRIHGSGLNEPGRNLVVGVDFRF